MDFTGLLMIAALFSYAGFTIYVANQIAAADAMSPSKMGDSQALPASENRLASPTLLRWLLYGVTGMTFILGLTVLQSALFRDFAAELQAQNPDAILPNVSLLTGALTFAAATAAGLSSYRLIASEEMRQRLAVIVQRWGGRFDPDSAVHLVAAVLMLAVAVWTLVNFVLQGGVEGIAQDFQAENVQIGDVLFQGVLEIVVTLLGVGLAIRRGLPETLARLGLRWPTRADAIWGLGGGLALMFVMLVFNLVWAAAVSQETIEQQTSAAQQLNLAFSTLPLAFLLAASAALGEEIWIRGGLQPVFGIGISSVFFTILHIQVAFTPATVLIFLVSLGLGWLRQRHSTTAAIVAHFCYNFVPLALLSLTGGMV